MSLETTLAKKPNLELARKLKVAIWVITVIVLLLVGSMRQIKIPLPDGIDLSFLPAVHATLNSLVAILLVTAIVLVKQKNIVGHQMAISAAMACSIAFLTCYVAYHFTNEETRFGGEGTIRIVYYVLLASHVVLAAVSFPFILFTWMYGYTHQFAKHRRLARFVFPVWLYVAISGPICYLLLRPYY
jgi:putative membrane protein